MTGNAQAAYITGVTATTNFGAGLPISQITDGSGLSALSLTATHTDAGPSSVWEGLGTSGSIDFNLHGSYSLSNLSVWNFSASGGNNNIGVKNLSILTSTDGSNYSPLVGAPLLFAMGADGGIQTSEQFSFPAVTASHMRFNITSNWGSGFTGLDEVAFGGTPASAPEPSGLALLGIGAAALVARRRRAI